MGLLGRVGRRVEWVAFRVWGRLPLRVRMFAVRRATPSFHVGAICVIERADGCLLLVRNAYRSGWGFPGGFLKRGEKPLDAVRRETHEEIGLDVALDDNPKVVVDAGLRRVDVIFTGRPAPGSDDEKPSPQSPEIEEVQWFSPTDLPVLMEEAVTALIELGRAQRPRLEGG